MEARRFFASASVGSPEQIREASLQLSPSPLLSVQSGQAPPTHLRSTPMKATNPTQPATIDRRALLALTASVAASAVLAPSASADDRDWTGKRPARYPDQDIVVLDKRFEKYKIGNTPI